MTDDDRLRARHERELRVAEARARAARATADAAEAEYDAVIAARDATLEELHEAELAELDQHAEAIVDDLIGRILTGPEDEHAT
jgi:hypothetical protein